MINNETVFKDIRQLESGTVETLDLNNYQWNRLSKGVYQNLLILRDI